MKIEEIKEKYPDEWVLIEVTKTQLDNGWGALEGNVLAHSKDRDDTYDAMVEYKGVHTFHFYTGEPPEDLVMML